MQVNKKSIIQTIFFAVLGIALVTWRYQTLEDADKQAMFDAFDSFKWSWSIPIILTGILSHYVRAKRWELQFKALQIPYKTFYTFSAVMLGYLTNIFIPRLGEVSKCSVMVKYNGGNLDKVIGTVIAERLWDTISFGVLTLLTLVLQFDLLMPYALQTGSSIATSLKTTDGTWMTGKLALLGIGTLLLLLLAICFFKKLKNSKAAQFIEGMANGLKSIWMIPNKALFLFYTIALWTCYTAIAVMVFKAIPATAHLPLLAGLSIITFGTFAMIVPAPGAIAYPVIVAPILQLYGTSAGVGQGYGWINWANQNIVVILLGLIVMILLPLYNTRQNDKQARNHST